MRRETPPLMATNKAFVRFMVMYTVEHRQPWSAMQKQTWPHTADQEQCPATAVDTSFTHAAECLDPCSSPTRSLLSC